jgi:F-type H+/Na+-transporting ATPase subunit alpha
MPTDSQRPGVSPGNRVLDPVPALVTEDQIQASSLSVVEEVLGALRHKRQAFSARLQGREVGTITGLSAGIATISGLPGVGFEELVQFPGNLLGMAFNVDAGQVSIVLLGDYAHLRAGDEAERTGRVLDIGVGEELLGRVVDPLGRPLDGQAAPHCGQRLPIERPAKAILDRAPVEVPLQTGIKVVDALVPIGRGQRELILGDRQTGKTTLALDAILNQKDQNVVCVYCAIGQRASAVARVIAKLRQGGGHGIHHRFNEPW